QLAENELQRFQGALMTMDQVMRSLRGQNAGERERLRQEHLRMEVLQGSLVAEVEAIRAGAEEERVRLGDRWRALEEKRRTNEEENRAARRDLDARRMKLEADRASFAELKAAATKAAEEAAAIHAREEEHLSNSRHSLRREALALEARLTASRTELESAESLRLELASGRAENEAEHRHLQGMAQELERALDEVRSRWAEAQQRAAEADAARKEALMLSKEARQARSSLQLKATELEEAARKQEADRAGIAQARAESSKDRSEIRRLRSELSRAL
ncbi:unnamed protein product, partial [Discosporangium mesarthrocarpum]